MLFLCSLITQSDYNCNFLEFFRRKRAHSSKCPCCYSSDEDEENNATTKKEVGWFAFSTDVSARSVGNRGAFAVAVSADEWVECPKLGNNNLQWLFVVENLLRRPCGIWQTLRKRNRIERLCRALSRCSVFKKVFIEISVKQRILCVEGKIADACNYYFCWKLKWLKLPALLRLFEGLVSTTWNLDV